MKKLKRDEVYDILNEERDYQDIKWGGSEHDTNHSISDFFLFMRKHMNDAENALYSSNAENAMDAIRKVTALGVALMESKGCPRRND